MNRTSFRNCAAIAALLMMPALAFSVPVINSISPSKTPANTGVTVDILGTGFGSLTDLVYFPDATGSHIVNPQSLIAGGVRVRVPDTWSGNVSIQANGLGVLSNTVNHDISYNYSGEKWFTMPFQWDLNTNAAPGCTFVETRDALVRGYDAWECASGLSTSYRFSTVLATTSQDGINLRYWSNSGWNPGTIAVANWWYWIASGEIIDADIAFNSQHYTWSCTGAAGDMDVGHIGTHEEGHTIGLLDMYGAADSAKTMYGYGNTGDTHNQTLHRDDVYGAEFMYSHLRANFTAATPIGWSFPLIPRNTNDATFAFCPLPATLNGNTMTYMNAAWVNNGSDCASPHGLNRLYLDDVYAYWNSWSGVWGAGNTGSSNNMGITVKGGRHTLKHTLDFDDETVEYSESDNIYQKQYVWSPYVLANQTPVYTSPPPVRGPFTYYNSDGYEFSAGGTWWGCVGIMPINSGDDYDLRLHNDPPTSTNGFDTYDAVSSWGSGTSDFVLVNGNTGGGSAITRWVGINRYLGGSGNLYVQLSQNKGTVAAPTTTLAYSMGSTEIVGMHEVYLGTATSWDFYLDNLSGTANLGFAIYDNAGTHFGKSNYLAYANTYGGGLNESFTFVAPTMGHYGVVVFKSNSADMGKANTYRLDIQLTPPNLRPYNGVGWDSPVVLRNDNTAISGNVHVSPTLDGNTNNTYLSVLGINDGPNPASQNNSRVYIDNGYSAWINWGVIGANGLYVQYNLGTFNIRGGRHMVEWRNDWDNLVAESIETDNSHFSQYVWSPLFLADQLPVLRSTPPVNGFTEGFLYPNSDGFELNWSGFWGAVGCLPSTSAADYDVRLHNDPVTAQNGFDTYDAWSGWGPGKSDFVLVNGNNAGGFTGTRQVGIFNFNSGSGNMAVQQSNRVAYLLAPATGGPYGLTTDMVLQVFEVYFAATGNYTFNLDQIAGTCNLGFSLYDKSGVQFSKSDYIAFADSAPDGAGETFSVQIDSTGFYGLVVWKSGFSDFGKTSTYNLGISLTPPNLTSITAIGWDYPLVVRNDNTAAAGNVHVSPILDGNLNTTYFNLSGINDGPNPAAHNRTRLFLDDVWEYAINWGTINAGQAFQDLNAGTFISRGGRHTLKWVHDWDATIVELNEWDNIYSRQFVWSPLTLLDEVPLVRAAPPVMGSGIYPNSDGFRFDSRVGFAWVTALGPDVGTDDLDLFVYSDYAGAQSGYSFTYGTSMNSSGLLDYVGGSYGTGGPVYYPAGIRFSGGSAGYTQDAADSSPDKVAVAVPASWSFESLNPGRLVDIFEVNLAVGIEYTMNLANTSGGADLGVHAFAPSTAVLTPFAAAYSWNVNGAGGNETGVFTPTEAGYYAFVVFKRSFADFPATVAYAFSVVDALASVDQMISVPTRFALGRNTPNPFNPKTVIKFEVPDPGARVRLEIFDLMGRRVRQLVDESFAAGRFEAVWNGRNDRGEQQSSGMFIYRMTAGSYSESAIMTLVK